MNKKQNDNLFLVANGIMDSAASEYRDMYLQSIDAVKDYADGALDIVLNDAEAELIFHLCSKMQARLDAGVIPGTDDWYHDWEAPLRSEVSAAIVARKGGHVRKKVKVTYRDRSGLIHTAEFSDIETAATAWVEDHYKKEDGLWYGVFSLDDDDSGLSDRKFIEIRARERGEEIISISAKDQQCTKKISELAAALGARGGSARTEAKAEAARENGKKGGRPKFVRYISCHLNSLNVAVYERSDGTCLLVAEHIVDDEVLARRVVTKEELEKLEEKWSEGLPSPADDARMTQRALRWIGAFSSGEEY